MIPRTNLTVLELGNGRAVHYAGHLLANVGVEVHRPPPAGDLPNILTRYLDAEKRVIDQAPDSVQGYDGVVADAPESPHAEAALTHWLNAAARGPLAMVTVSPLGWRRESGWRGTDLEAAALSGVAWAIGDPSREPLGLPHHLADYIAGSHAAGALLAAARHARRTGQGQSVDISAALVLAWFTHVNSTVYTPYGIPWRRAGRRASGSGGPYPYALFRCADGWVAIIARTPRDWDRFLEAMGHPAWADDPRYRDQVAMGRDYPDEVDEHVAPLLRQRTRAELSRLAREHGFPLAPVNTLGDVLAEPQFQHRHFFQVVGPKGQAVRLPASPFAFSQPPTPGAAAATEPGPLPLSGLTVLDLAWVWSGPLVSQALASMGANVIKVEHGDRLDNSRLRGRPHVGAPLAGPTIEIGPYFHAVNAGKRSVTINMKETRGQELVRQLAEAADALVENLSPGALGRLGLSYSDLAPANPRLIYLSMSAAGQTGPLSTMRAYAPIMSSLAGLEALIGYPGDEPVGMMTMGLADPNAASHALVAFLAALHGRDQTGQGCHIDMSQSEALLCIMAEALAQHQAEGPVGPSGNRAAGVSPRGVYPCREPDSWIALTIISDNAWQRFCLLVLTSASQGRDPLPVPWAADPQYRITSARVRAAALLDECIGQWTRRFYRDHLVALLQSHQVAAAPVLSVEDHETHPYFAQTPFLQPVHHPLAGVRRLAVLPWAMSATPPHVPGPAPLLGQHNYEVLHDLLGLSSGELAELAAGGVIR